jgi:hypothetical protein
VREPRLLSSKGARLAARPRLVIPAAVILCAVGLSCGAARPAGQTGGPTPGSGIEGRTQASPTCPVASAGNPCPPRPISATVVVLDGAGREVTRFTSSADGTFRVPLAPGTYMLVQPPTTQRRPPVLHATPVTVSSGGYTSLVLDFDTGIR